MVEAWTASRRRKEGTMIRRRNSDDLRKLDDWLLKNPLLADCMGLIIALAIVGALAALAVRP